MTKGNYEYLKSFSDFGGVDLRSSELMRPRGMSKEFLNLTSTPTSGIGPRFGTKTMNSSVGTLGLWSFETTTMLGTRLSEMLAAGTSTSSGSHNLRRRNSFVLTFTNSNASAATVSVYYDEATSQFRFKVVRGGSTIVNEDLGYVGVGGQTISSLCTAVSAVSGCSLVITSDVGGTATVTLTGLLDLVDDVVVAGAGGTTTIQGYTFGSVPNPKFEWVLSSSSVSTSLDTIDMTYGGTTAYANPLRNGDSVVFRALTGGAVPAGITAGTSYFVVNATTKYIQLSTLASGAPVIDITTTGTSPFTVSSTVVNPGATFWNYWVEMGEPSWRPVSSVLLRGVLYFSTGRTKTGTGTETGLQYRETVGLMKYDGQKFYRAGAPPGDFGTLSTSASDIQAAGDYTDVKGRKARGSVTGWAAPSYDMQYKYIDKVGNQVLGPLRGEFIGADSGNGVYLINYLSSDAAWLPRRLGFNAAYAILTAGATSLSLAVDNGHGQSSDLVAGDIAYFWDDRQDRFIQREVISNTGTLLTLSSQSLDTDPSSMNYDDGQTPTVLIGAAISANLRVCLYRSTLASGGANAFKYVLDELPWCPLYTSYYDEHTDAMVAANGDLIEPAYQGQLPPACRHLSVFNSQLVMSGDESEPQRVYFEDIETPEGVPPGTHNFDMDARVTGHHACGDVIMVGTQSKISAVSGDLSEFKFKVDPVSENIGILSHASIQQVEEGICFFLSNLGPYSMQMGRQLQPLAPMKYPDGRTASRVEPFFTADYTNATTYPQRPYFERAVGAILSVDRQYLLFVPTEPVTRLTRAVVSATDPAAGSNVFVFDYGRNRFYRWIGVDFSSMCVVEDTLWYAARTYLSTNSPSYMQPLFGRQVRNKGKYCYADHTAPITTKAQFHWEALGNPAAFKRAIRCRIITTEGQPVATTVRFRTYVDYDLSKVSTETTLSLTTTQPDIKFKLNGEVARSHMVEFYKSDYYTPFFFTGYELQMVANFREAFKE